MNNGLETLLAFLLLAIVIGVTWKGAVKLFYKYNTLLVIAYVVFIFPIAFCHIILLGLFGDTKEQILQKKVEEQVRFESLVEEEKNK